MTVDACALLELKHTTKGYITNRRSLREAKQGAQNQQKYESDKGKEKLLTRKRIWAKTQNHRAKQWGGYMKINLLCKSDQILLRLSDSFRKPNHILLNYKHVY